MYIRELRECAEFVAGDNCLLREILHPDKADLAIRYSLAHAVVKPGDTTWNHRLKTSEVYYIMDGEGVMHINGESAPVRPGSTVYIPPMADQCITNSGKTDLKFICIVDPAWRAEDEVVAGRQNRSNGNPHQKNRLKKSFYDFASLIAYRHFSGKD